MPAPSRNKWCDNRSGNDEARMTNDETNLKFEIRNSEFGAEYSVQVFSFGFRHSFAIRHSDFLI
jgi:hypothetical protein